MKKRNLALADAQHAKSLEPDLNFRQADLFIEQIKRLNELIKSLENEPTAELFNELVIMFFNYNLWDEARKQFHHALDLDPKFSEAHNNLAGACINLED